MKAIELNAQPRTVTGKKVKKLRREGLLPISVFGKDVKSVALSVPIKEFQQIYNKAGETGLVEVKFDGKSHHTLISNVQIHPVSRLPIHAELHAVKLTEKIKANVPLETIGESPAVQNNIGTILHILTEVEVEALPIDLPEKIEVNIENLAEIDQQVTVGDLPKPKGVEIMNAPEEIVLKVAPAVSEDTAKELAEEEAAKAAEATAEGAEGESKPTESTSDAPKEEKSE